MVHAREDSPWPILDRLVERVLDTRREVAAAQAAEVKLLAGAVELIAERTAELRRQGIAGSSRVTTSDLPAREISLELGMAMRMSDRTVQNRISEAYVLVEQFPRTFAAFSAGDIDAGHAWAISRAGILLTDDEDRHRYEDLALDAASTESPARMAAAAKAIAAAVCPEAFAAAARAAAEDRCVRLYELPDGLARIVADLPAPLAYAIVDRLDAMARAVLAAPDVDAFGDADTGGDGNPDATRTAGPTANDNTRTITTGPGACAEPTPDRPDARKLDQVRADLFCDMLLTTAPSAHGTEGALAAIMGRVQVTVPALTLAGDPSGGPALLAGYGPIDSDLARRLAGLAPGWDRVFLDPCSGEPLAVDRYRPSAQIARFLAARDERCRAPGCTRPAHRCDNDHTIAASDGGRTSAANLASFCRRHHICKHHTTWRVRQIGHGIIEWTGPTGRRYRDRPPAVVRFVPAVAPPMGASDADPPPF